MDNYYNNGWQSQNSYAPSVNTNIILVTSVDEALYRTNAKGSDMVYFDQAKDVFYRVKVDMDGRKYWKEIPFGAPTENSPVTRAELANISKRLEELEKLNMSTQEAEKNV